MFRQKRTRSEGQLNLGNSPNDSTFNLARQDQHHRSHSLAEINCLCRQSLSSIEALQTAAKVALYPLKPYQPPPSRSSTPPGLPSFGTREAQELRLVPRPSPSRLRRIFQRTFGGNSPNLATATPNRWQGEIYNQNALNDRVLDSAVSRPAQLLRRATGSSVPVAIPADTLKPRKVKLPKGVKRTYVIGPLAQAEDGSHIRGRFGYRASGHGIGHHTVSTHPFSWSNEVNSCHDIGEEIQKSCPANSRRRQVAPRPIPFTGQGLRDGLHPTSAYEDERREAAQRRAILETHQHSPASGQNYPCITEYETIRDGLRTDLRPISAHQHIWASTEAMSPTSISTDSFRTLRGQEVASRGMVEPLPYVPFLSSSDAVSPSTARSYVQDRDNLPTVEDMLNLQEREHYIRIIEQRRQEAQRTSLELC